VKFVGEDHRQKPQFSTHINAISVQGYRYTQGERKANTIEEIQTHLDSLAKHSILKVELEEEMRGIKSDFSTER